MSRTKILGWVALVVAATSSVSRSALAQTYEKAEGQVRENIPAAPFLAAAYGFIWVAVIVYVALVARRLARVQGEMEELRRRLSPK